MSSNTISDPGVIPIILQEQMDLESGKFDMLPEDVDKSSFLSDLKTFLYRFLGKLEKDSGDPGFKYVGLLEYPTDRQNYMLYFLPKYYDMDKVDSAKDIRNKETDVYKDFSLVMKTLNKYRMEKSHSAINENRLQTHVEPDFDTVKQSSKLAIAVTLIEDYLENGVYTNMKTLRSLHGNGEIDWEHTINTINPVIRDRAPYYFDYWTTDRAPDTETLIARLHETIIKDCSISLVQWGLDDLLELETPLPCDGELNDFGEKEGIIAIINQELSVQFITQKQNLLKLMRTYIELEDFSIAESVSMFGTGSFHAVWEKVCGTVFGNQLEDGIDPDLLPKEMKNVIRWSDIEARAKWEICEKDGDKSPDEKDASKLKPDIVALDKENSVLYILDAKYYIPDFSGNSIKKVPGIGDINKQHLYQLSYHPLIGKNNWKVMNAFLMPESKKNSAGSNISAFSSIFDKDLKVTDKDGNIFSFAKIRTVFLRPEDLFQNYLDDKREELNKKFSNPDVILTKKSG